MASPSRKRGRTTSGGEEEGEPVAVAAGFEAPIFGARAVGQVTTLVLEGEDRPLASSCMASQAITRAAGTIRLGPRGCTSRRLGACAPLQPARTAAVFSSAGTAAQSLWRTPAT